MPAIEEITDASDARVAEYRDLRDPELRARHGLFAVESRLVVRRLLGGSRFRTRSLLLTPAALESLRDLIQLLHGRTPVYVTSIALVQAIVGFRFHQGCVALGERGVELDPEELVAPPGSRALLLLDEITDPENVGGLFRIAMAFGIGAVLLSAGASDPLYRKAIRVSTGATLAVPFARLGPWRAGLDRLRQAGYAVLALTPSATAVPIEDFGRGRDVPPRVAVIVGTEGAGLRAETREAADLQVRIPMAPGVDSLNVVTAAAIALHRIRAPFFHRP